MAFAKSAVVKGIRVIIAGAGGAAHLPGMIAAHTIIPVLGVPIETKNPERYGSAVAHCARVWRHSGGHISDRHCRAKMQGC